MFCEMDPTDVASRKRLVTRQYAADDRLQNDVRLLPPVCHRVIGISRNCQKMMQAVVFAERLRAPEANDDLLRHTRKITDCARVTH
jgi:hypothetical protein